MAKQYKVVELRESLFGGKMNGKKLEKTLNDEAKDGWELNQMAEADVKGRMGSGDTEGIVLIFEKPA